MPADTSATSLELSYSSDLVFNSRRSPVLSRHGAVASSQTHASQIGIAILQAGGNAVDACVAMAAALNVTEPTSTGIGGDCFAIVYDPVTKRVEGLNGSGRAPLRLSLDTLPASAIIDGELDPLSVHCITVPGAAAGWCDAIDRWGSMTLERVLEPAAQLAEHGFPVAPITAHSWKASESLLQRHEGGQQLLVDGRAPTAGAIFANPHLASTFRLLAAKGKDGFYAGSVADAIIELTQSLGGHHTHEDLRSHVSTFPVPIRANYRGVDVWELPPNGQGLTALLALNILSQLEPPLASHDYGTADHAHLMIEALRLAFSDTRYYIADSDHVRVPVQELLSDEYARKRAALLHRARATVDHQHGSPVAGSDTVSFCAVDAKGMACSFINSNYTGFGSALAPKGCGFTLQNRGFGFCLERGHPNALAGGKRPYHTIIPGMATVAATGDLFGPFSVMGGFMQPQGHVQVITAMIDYQLEPQRALDLPRFCIERGTAGGHVLLEDGVTEEVFEELKKRGHDVRRVRGWARAVFGRGQIIRVASNGVRWAGSDGRADGAAMGY